jgi:hypothetical protein
LPKAPRSTEGKVGPKGRRFSGHLARSEHGATLPAQIGTSLVADPRDYAMWTGSAVQDDSDV